MGYLGTDKRCLASSGLGDAPPGPLISQSIQSFISDDLQKI